MVIASLVVVVAREFGAKKAKPLPPVGAGYWHTSGTAILDAYNRPVRIAAVTWFGAESSTWVPGGLDFQRYQEIMNEVKRLGYNAIRLPFSNQLVEENPVVHSWVNANPELRGRRALTVMDDIVHYAGKIGLKIILDDQISASEPLHGKGLGSGPRLDEPLWYTSRYPQSAWIRDWTRLARRYRSDSAVIGFDLRNEPHTAGPGPWTIDTYLNQGSTWGRFDGIENPKTDWRLAAKRCGDAVLKINSKLLIFVEGLQLYPQAGRRHGVDSYWWGGILRQVRKYPIVLSRPHQLVYSPHEYGPQKWPYYWWWRHLTYRRLARELDRQWGFILNHPRAKYAAPIFLGETGTCTNFAYCVNDGPPAASASPSSRIRREQGRWLHLIVRYIRRHPNLGWSLWALNGTNALDQDSTDGLLNVSWTGVQSRKLQRLLSMIQ